MVKGYNRGKRWIGLLLAAAVFWQLAGLSFAAYGETGGRADPAAMRTASPSEGVRESEDAGRQKPQQKPVLTAESYEIYRGKNTSGVLDALTKGKEARIVVYMRGEGIPTRDAGQKGISVSKLPDSFRMSGTPRVKITSGPEEDLEFTVTFPRVTYLGAGNRLKFRVSVKKAGVAGQIQEMEISECIASVSGGKTENEGINGQPVMRIRRTEPAGPIGPGEQFVLGFEVENTSRESDAEDVVVSVTPGNSLFIGDDTNTRIIRSLGIGKTASLKFNMIAGTEISGPTQVMEVELKYNYYSGGNLTAGAASQKILIPVKGGSSSGQPAVRISRRGPDRIVGPGEGVQMTVILTNTSQDREIRSLTAVFEPGDQIALMDETDTRQLGSLKGGESVEIPVNLKAGPELSAAPSQLVGITLKFDYDSDKGPVQGSYSEKLVIPTRGTEKGPDFPAPNVIIKNYAYGDKVTAGQVFDLELEFGNTSTVAAVENVVMSMETGEGLSINSSSNTLYIPRMEPGEIRRERVMMQALFQSKVQSPKITISCKYEYVDKRERKQSSSSEIIAIPVYQPDRFQLSSPVLAEEFREGEEGTISIPYVNKGRGQVYNVEAVLDGQIDVLTRELNLGNLEPGKSGTIDFLVTPAEAGDFQGQVTVTYEDEAAEVRQVDIPVSFSVKESDFDPEDSGEDAEPENPKGGGRIWKWILSGAGLLLLSGAGIFYKRKKRNGGGYRALETWESGEDGGNEWENEEEMEEEK